MARALRMSGWIRPRAGRLAPQRPPRCCQRPSKGHSKAAGSPAVMPLLAHGQIQHSATWREIGASRLPEREVACRLGSSIIENCFPKRPGARLLHLRMSGRIRPRAGRLAPQRPPRCCQRPSKGHSTGVGSPAVIFLESIFVDQGSLNGNRPSHPQMPTRPDLPCPAVMPLLAHGQIQHCARLLHGAGSPFFFFWKAYLSIEGTLNGNRPS